MDFFFWKGIVVKQWDFIWNMSFQIDDETDNKKQEESKEFLSWGWDIKVIFTWSNP